MYTEHDRAVDYLLQSLIKNNGQANFHNLHGKGVKSNDIVNAQNFLICEGYITHVPGQFNLMFRITQSGRNFYCERLRLRVLSYLADNRKISKFFKVRDVFKALSINENDGLADAVETSLIEDKLVYEISEGGIKIKESIGVAYLTQGQYGIRRESNGNTTINDNSVNVGESVHGSIISGQSSVLGDANDFSHNVTIAQNVKDNANTATSWYCKPVFIYLIWPILVGIIILMVAIILNHRYGLSG